MKNSINKKLGTLLCTLFGVHIIEVLLSIIFEYWWSTEIGIVYICIAVLIARKAPFFSTNTLCKIYAVSLAAFYVLLTVSSISYLFNFHLFSFLGTAEPMVLNSINVFLFAGLFFGLKIPLSLKFLGISTYIPSIFVSLWRVRIRFCLDFDNFDNLLKPIVYSSYFELALAIVAFVSTLTWMNKKNIPSSTPNQPANII